MNIVRDTLIVAGLAFAAGHAHAADDTKDGAPVHSAPSAPPLAGDEQAIEPDVTITQQGSTRIEEYRVAGRLYMIKIIPSKGLPYYLMDADGNGSLETRRNDVEPDILVPRWTIWRF